MKRTLFIGIAILAMTLGSCNAQSPKSDAKASSQASSDKIEAYYFHFTTRCNTCKTLEANAKTDLETLYPELFKNGMMAFQSINLDDAASESLAKQLGVSGQTLLFVKGDKKINLTNEGFMYAVVKPEKFREVIKEKMDLLINGK